MGYSSRRPSFRAQREIFFVPFFPDFFAKPFTGSTVRLSAIRCFPFLAVRHSPSYHQRKRSLGSASDDDTGNVLFPHILCMMHGIAIPHAVISSAARNLFRPLFPDFFAKPFTGSTAPAFPRHGVSRSSLSNTLRLTVNEKDPSTSLPMTIRETRLFHFPRYGVSVSCYQTCTINKRAMNKTVHGSFICTPAGIITNP